MNAPKLEKDQCSILIAEYATGHVYKKDLTLFISGDSEREVFQLCDNFSKAENFALNFIKNNPQFECLIYNQNGDYMKTFDITGERKFDKKNDL